MKKLQKITIVCLLLANAYGCAGTDSESNVTNVTNGTIEPNAIEHVTENKIENELEKKIKKLKPKKNIIDEQEEGFWVKDIKQAGWSLVKGGIGIGLVCATYYYHGRAQKAENALSALHTLSGGNMSIESTQSAKDARKELSTLLGYYAELAFDRFNVRVVGDSCNLTGVLGDGKVKIAETARG